MCGEHHTNTLQKNGLPGSSPRVWGAYCRKGGLVSNERIIPTCVGSIKHGVVAHASPPGSSPRVWGALDCSFLQSYHSGIIPTCVGSISSTCGCSAVIWDHPHVCGEHFVQSHTLSFAEGSSPRVWGASPLCGMPSLLQGIIPTCVGSIRNA
mgnify:CR=1 FL=1